MNLYSVADHCGEHHLYTAKSFHDRILQEATLSDYGWSAPITEIAKVIRDPNYPKQYTIDLCKAVLQCYSAIQTTYLISSREQNAIWDCYFTLDPSNRDEYEVRAHYVRKLINNAVYQQFPVHVGIAWQTFCRKFQEEKFNEWRLLLSDNNSRIPPRVAIKDWAATLRDDFQKRQTKAEEDGCFEEDDKLEWAKIALLTRVS